MSKTKRDTGCVYIEDVYEVATTHMLS